MVVFEMRCAVTGDVFFKPFFGAGFVDLMFEPFLDPCNSPACGVGSGFNDRDRPIADQRTGSEPHQAEEAQGYQRHFDRADAIVSPFHRA